MSQKGYSTAKKREAGVRGISTNNMIADDTRQVMLAKKSLIDISNIASKSIHRKLNIHEIDQLVDFIGQIPTSSFYGMNNDEVKELIAQSFVHKYFNDKLIKQGESVDTDYMEDYQKQELMQFTKDENQLKYSTFADRRGNAFIDKDRVDPHKTKVSADETNLMTYKGMKSINEFLNPDSLESMFARFHASSTTFENVTLPHQLILFNSRNRLMTHTTRNEYKWNIHSAGDSGNNGDVRLMDTLKEIVRMRIFPFWIPMPASTLNYYEKVRMLIREFSSQSVIVTEFLDSNSSYPTNNNYHFEFDIQKVVQGRAYLVPCNDTFSFRKPFARLDTMTVCFRTPYDQLVLQTDRDIYNVTYGNPTVFTLASGSDNGLSTGDLIYVLDLQSSSTTLNTTVNSQTGYIISKLASNQFSIPVDTSTLSGSTTGVHVYYGSKRITFQIEMTSLEQ